MYIPKYNRLDDPKRLHTFMLTNSFATLVSDVAGEPFATHVPVRTHVNGEQVSLKFHLAKANPHADALRASPVTLAIFHGPHAYISPSNYASEENVPTWNYVAVHAYGAPHVVEDRDAKLALLADVIGHYESAFQFQWDALSDKYRDGMLQGIVAFEMPLTRIEGKAKLSQNRPVEDQAQVAEWLQAHAHRGPREVGRLMRENIE
jgi:transcriptional regulator